MEVTGIAVMDIQVSEAMGEAIATREPSTAFS